MNPGLPILSLVFVLVTGGLALAGGAWLWWTRARFRVPRKWDPACPECTYRLVHRTDACPECGLDLERTGVGPSGTVNEKQRTVRAIVLLALAIVLPMALFQFDGFIQQGAITRTVRTEIWRGAADGSMQPEATFDETVTWFGTSVNAAGIGGRALPAVPANAVRTVSVWAGSVGIWRDDGRDVMPGPPLGEVEITGSDASARVTRVTVDRLVSRLDAVSSGGEDGDGRSLMVRRALEGPAAIDGMNADLATPVGLNPTGTQASYTTRFSRLVRLESTARPNGLAPGERAAIKRRTVLVVRPLLGWSMPVILPIIWLGAGALMVVELVRAIRCRPRPMDDPRLRWDGEPG